MLTDKCYYDYDFEPLKPKKRKPTAEERKLWSDEKLRSILSRAINPGTGKGVFDAPAPQNAEQLQRDAMADLNQKHH